MSVAPSPGPIRAVILDLDGLMLDTEPVYRRAWTEAASELGFDIPPSFYDTCIGVPNSHCEQMALKYFGAQFPLPRFAPAWRERFAEIARTEGIRAKPGLRHLLDTISRLGLRMALATSSSRREIATNPSARDLVSMFSVVTTCDDIAHPKPHPETYTLTLRALGLSAPQAVAVEDSNNGMRSAIDAGMAAIMVPDLVKPDSDVQRGALAVVASLAEAADIVRRIAGSSEHATP